MDIYQCPKCYTEFALGMKFCQNCRCNLETEFIKTPTCPKCRKIFAIGTNFCNVDGSKLVSPEKLIPRCVKCGKEYTDDTKFCPQDGGLVIAEASGKGGNGGFKEKGIELVENWITKSDEFHENESKKAFKTSTFFSIGVLVSFFLPWVDYVITRFSAFEIPMALDSFANFGQLFGNNITYVKFTYLLYLIPCFAIYNIISDLTKKENRWGVSEFWTGLTFIAILLFLVLANGGNLSVFGVGFYLTALFSVLGLVYSDR